MPVFPQSNFVEMWVAIGFEDVGGAKRRVGASIFSACMWFHRNAPASSAARGRRDFHQPPARQPYRRNDNVHPAMVSSLSRSGSYIIMWPQCFASASSTARGRRQDGRPLAHHFFSLPSVNMPEGTLWADVWGCASDQTAHILHV